MTSRGSLRTIGAKTFTAADQDVFALASADRNPMHVDAIAARRLLTGKPVVHGAHVLLTALAICARHVPVMLAGLSCSFDNPVSIDDTVVFVLDDTDPAQVQLEGTVGGLRCVHLAWPRQPAPSQAGDAVPESMPHAEPLPTFAVPLDRSPQSHAHQSYVVRCLQTEAAAGLPAPCEALGAANVAAVCALSYFVGMVCPGLNSIFAAIEIESLDSRAAPGTLRFDVEKFDARVGLFVTSFSGVLRGRLRAFLRPEPKAQPAFLEVSEHVGADEFAGRRCLVVGGSRGLGELTAKALAAGGARVDVTYAAGAVDARRVCDEINTHRPGRARNTQWDINTTAPDRINLDWATFDAVYYFATPRIFRKKVGVFQVDLHRELVEFYVLKFYRMCEHLESQCAQPIVRVLLPSTVYVTERPKGLAEYAMAKAAAEVLAQEINTSFKRVRIHCPRLPRVDTDQTASIIKQRSSYALDVVLQAIRGMHAV